MGGACQRAKAYQANGADAPVKADGALGLKSPADVLMSPRAASPAASAGDCDKPR